MYVPSETKVSYLPFCRTGVRGPCCAVRIVFVFDTSSHVAFLYEATRSVSSSEGIMVPGIPGRSTPPCVHVFLCVLCKQGSSCHTSYTCTSPRKTCTTFSSPRTLSHDEISQQQQQQNGLLCGDFMPDFENREPHLSYINVDGNIRAIYK